MNSLAQIAINNIQIKRLQNFKTFCEPKFIKKTNSSLLLRVITLRNARPRLSLA